MSILYKNIASFLFITFSFLFSVSAPPFPFEVQQPDGSKITVRMYGHEYYNWMETEDGYVIDWVEDESRQGWYYRDLDSDGRFYTSHILVKYPAPDYLDIPRQLREMSPPIREIKHHNLHSRISHSTYLDRSASSSLIKPLVFLVDFNNLPAGTPDREYSKDQFQHLLFDTNLNSNNANLPSDYDMSVRDYYYEISNETLEISGDDESIVGWTTADYVYSYYVDEAQGTGQGPNGISRSAAALVVEIAMDKNSEINFADFDGDSDGVVDMVLLIVEGWGNGDDDQFWPHMSLIQSGVNGIDAIDPNAPTDNDGYFSLDGVAIKKYIVIPEQFHMNYYEVSKFDIHPIGTICHEMGHVLGLPDLYDTSENSAAGIGQWGLMGSGNWQRPTSPAYMSAWSRYRLGFIEPVILENITDYDLTIQPAEQNENSAAFMLPMDSNLPQEYILLENRQRIGSDQHLSGTGMLVWHIDETITDMYPAMNSVNVNQDFYGVNLLQADGKNELNLEEDNNHSNNSDSGDPFPGSSGNTQISTSTNPNTYTYDYDRDADGTIDMGGDSGIELVNISENADNSITLTVYNPNQQGEIIGYDEGGFSGSAIDDSYSYLQWAGIRVVANETAMLAGVKTVFPPSFWPTWDVTDYTIQIWEGWSNNKPVGLLYTYTGDVQWTPEELRDGGWAFISFQNEQIIWNEGETYYIEINYNGTGGVYPFDGEIYSNSTNNNMSYYRGTINDNCTPLSNTIDGDWNIRAVLSGQNCGVHEDKNIWPGDTDGNSVVDAYDILPIGVYYGYQGCYRQGSAYSWEEQPLPNGWEVEVAAYADANGDGKVDIADVLVILVNWTESDTPVSSSSDDCHYTNEEMERYRDNFYEIYQGLTGSSEPAVFIRRKLEELFGFGILPSSYILGKNYPNPFNPRTVIPFYAPHSGQVEIIIYDMGGRVVKKLAHSHNEEGWYELIINAENMSSGIYLYRLAGNGEFLSTNMMLLLK